MKMEQEMSQRRTVTFSYKIYGNEVELSDPFVRIVHKKKGTCELPFYPDEALSPPYKKKPGYSTTRPLIRETNYPLLVENSATVLMKDEDRKHMLAKFTPISDRKTKKGQPRNEKKRRSKRNDDARTFEKRKRRPRDEQLRRKELCRELDEGVRVRAFFFFFFFFGS